MSRRTRGNRAARAAGKLIAIARRRPEPFIAATGLVGWFVARLLLNASDVAQMVLLVALVTGGFRVVVGTVGGMVRGRFAADIVASLAIITAAVTGEYLAGCVIVLMQTGGEALEDEGKRRASATLDGLLARAPHLAHIRRGDTMVDLAAKDVVRGDLVVVRPGEIFPVDGVVERGSSAVDESALTGEAVPIAVSPGSEVMSGSVCLHGALEVRAARPAGESQYERIVRMVQTAQGEKAPIGRLADRYAVVFTPLTLLMAGLAYIIVRRPEAVLAVLVVATPCPLVLATPIAVLSGINRAARRGIIVKSGAAIEQVGQATAAVFDKTGTLTTGTPVVQQFVPLDGYRASEVLRFGAGLEQMSGHPMAHALVAAGREQLGALPIPEAVVETPGHGISGRIDQREVAVGSVAFAVQHGLATRETLDRARLEAGAGHRSIAVIGIDGRAAGLAIFTDPLRTSVPAMLRRLRQLGVRETVVLTGDDEATARSIAAEAGIGDVRANLLPASKVDAVRELLPRHRAVLMVGDGINDAPALATATVGIALAARGAAISAEAADVVITTDDVERVADAVAIGQRTLAVARQSIWIGMGVSTALMVVAAFGFIPPTVGAVCQEVLDVAVILNALRP